MLNSLHIENIAVIERADIAFHNGFHVLTGETGAGKSIIIDSLNAVLGERIGRDIIRTGCAGAAVSAIFSDIFPAVLRRLTDLGCEPDEDGALMLERRLSADGKAAARINGRPVTVAVLRAVGRLLVNIHGQHENQTLLDTATHVEYLDRLGGLQDERAAYTAAYQAYTQLRRALDTLDTDEVQKARRMDLLQYQIDEIEAADLQIGEEESLQQKREMFRNSEKILRALAVAHQYLNGDDEEAGALSLVAQAANALAAAGQYWETAQPLSEKVQSLQYELDACADELRGMADMLELDEVARDEVESRYELIRRLTSKYGRTVEDVLSYLAACRAEYDDIRFADEKKAQLTAQCDEAYRRLQAAGAALTAARQKAAESFAAAVAEQLTFLDMPRVRFCVSIKPADFTPRGADEVEFLLAANVGEQPRPLAKIASGGEMSRIMLALQTVLAAVDEIDTLVFDEVDTGVSGRAALKVGRKLRETAAGHRQVLCVTHLAQIAAQGEHHLLIEKGVRDERTYTQVTNLDEAGRERELARIIGGEITDIGIQAARELRREYGN